MSGGNHIIFRHTLALCLAVGLLAPAVAAEEPGFTTGIAAANVAWAKAPAIAETMTGIAAAGFESVRIGFKNPVAGTFRALDAAKAEGLEVLVTIPLIDGAVSAKGAEPRPRDRHFFPAYGLSQIDLARYDARLRQLLDRIADKDLPVIGLEIGNELNWSGYNGDLPVRPGGAFIADAAAWPVDERAAFEAGIDKYAAVIERTRAALQENPRFGNIKLVSAGLADINANFIHRVGASYIDPALVHDAFAARGLFGQVDAIGIHLYEPLRNAADVGDRPRMIATQLTDCGRADFAERPCWITEYGAALPEKDCAADDSRRIALMKPLLDHLALAENARRVPIGFYYDWNEDAGFSLLRCGRPTELTRELPRAGDAPQDNKGGTIQ
ncbi:hypothetical protein [Dongia sp.]|uniref:hypothetical protein n=1 Tax=Dongia sp. TaxID=1977262 RepID=UPI0035B3DDA9